MIMQRSRFAVPQRLNLEIERKNLVAQLKQAHERILILKAPSGYGKTTLAAQYCRSLRRKKIWFDSSIEDQDESIFVHNFYLAIKHGLPTLSFNYWSEAIKEKQMLPYRMLALCRDINNFSENCIIVIDAVEKLSEKSAQLVEVVAKYLGDGHQLILTYFGNPISIDFSVNPQDVLHLGTQELSFTEGESKLFLKHVQVPSHNHSKLIEDSAGWPIAMSLFTKNKRMGSAPSKLTEGLLSKVSPKLSKVIPQAAVLDTWDSSLWKDLELTLPNNWLEEIIETGIPVTKIGRQSYRPHPLVREGLEELLLDQNDYEAIYLRAAEYYESQSNFLRAIEYYRKGKDYCKALALLIPFLEKWQIESNWLSIKHALEFFPIKKLTGLQRSLLGISWLETSEAEKGQELLFEEIEACTRNPLAYYGVALLLFRQRKSQEMFDIACSGLELKTNRREYVMLQEAKLLASIDLLDIKGVNRIRDELLLILPECAPDIAIRIHSILGYTYSLGKPFEPSWDKVYFHLNKSCELAESLGWPQKMLPAVDRLVHQDLSLGFKKDNDDLPQSIKWVDKLIDYGELFYSFALPYMYKCRALYAFFENDLDSALSFYFKTSKWRETLTIAPIRLPVEKGIFDCYALKGNLKEAHVYFDKLPINDASNFDFDLNDATYQLNFLEQKFDTAEKDLNRLIEYNEESAETGTEYTYLCNQVEYKLHLAAIALNRQKLSKSDITNIMVHLDKLGSDDLLTRFALRLAKLYRHCIDQNWYANRFRPHLFAKSIVKEDRLPVLKIHTLGSVKASLEGKPFALTPTTLEVLIHMALFPQATVKKMACDIWHSEKKGRKNLKVHMRRLRLKLSDALNDLNTAFISWNQLTDKYEMSGFQLSLDILDIKSLNLNEPLGAILPMLDSEWLVEEKRFLTVKLVNEFMTQIDNVLSGEEKSKRLKQILKLDPYHQEASARLAANLVNQSRSSI